MPPTESTELTALRARVRELEAILLCVNCGHLRSEHLENDSPCYGGRTSEMNAGEGEYCNCFGFESAELPDA
jgi:hypothetical protein